MPINTNLKELKIISTRKSFSTKAIISIKLFILRKSFSRNFRQTCKRTEIFYIDILITIREGDRKIMQLIRSTKRPPMTLRKRNQFPHFRQSPN